LAAALALVGQRDRAEQREQEFATVAQALAAARQALGEARTLSAVAELAAGAAHELNNPLAVISGRAQILRDQGPDEAARRTGALIAEQAQRISDMLSGLLEFASPPRPRLEPTDPAAALRAAAAAFRASEHPQAAAARVDIEGDASVPAVDVDRRHLGVILAELLANAATAGAPRPHIAVRAEAVAEGRRVRLIVRDQGPGMDEATRAQAFTPFFSAQPSGRRRGLGLPRARRYAEVNGGRLWLDSRPGEGTRAVLELPAAATRSDEHGHTKPGQRAGGG